MLSGVGVWLLFRVSGSRTICCMTIQRTIPFFQREPVLSSEARIRRVTEAARRATGLDWIS